MLHLKEAPHADGAIHRPGGQGAAARRLRANEFTIPECPCSTCGALLPTASSSPTGHMRTVASQDPQARERPSGAQASEHALPTGPCSTCTAPPCIAPSSPTGHTRMVSSSGPEAREIQGPHLVSKALQHLRAAASRCPVLAHRPHPYVAFIRP